MGIMTIELLEGAPPYFKLETMAAAFQIALKGCPGLTDPSGCPQVLCVGGRVGVGVCAHA